MKTLEQLKSCLASALREDPAAMAWLAVLLGWIAGAVIGGSFVLLYFTIHYHL